MFEMFSEKFMKEAIALALNNAPFPNPRVGAVLVLNGSVVGHGWHSHFGGKHAEVVAIEDALSKNIDISQCDLYVTLEPCCHSGKQGPCCERIVKERIKKVYVGVLDKNELVSGKGVEYLRLHSMNVSVGFLEEEILAMNKLFYSFLSSTKPFVILKNGVSLNGKITSSGKYLNCPEALEKVHQLRGWVDGILVGVGTVIADNPQLTCRSEGKDPLRIVLDTHLRVSLDAKVFSDKNVVVCCGTDVNAEKLVLVGKKAEVIQCPLKDDHVDLEFVLVALRKRGVKVLLVEGGKQLNTSFFSQKLVDKFILITAPVQLDDSELDIIDKKVIDLDQLKNQFNLIVSEDLNEDIWCEYLRENL
jgi:diaminohydroxyphosphoribosylaminopyrimidine deaminase / 5-amino-6-(5-phosphoribosylamino)uracil reductase